MFDSSVHPHVSRYYVITTPRFFFLHKSGDPVRCKGPVCCQPHSLSLSISLSLPPFLSPSLSISPFLSISVSLSLLLLLLPLRSSSLRLIVPMGSPRSHD